MNLYARSDVMGVSIAVASGGCGQTHTRPVNNGAPAKTFELSCPQCSFALKDDVQWSKVYNDLPLTPAEQQKMEEEAKRGMISNKDDLVSGIAEGLASGLSGLTSCRSCGRMNPSGMRFCGECGGKLGKPDDAPVPVPEPVEVEESPDLRSMKLTELRDLAKERGVSSAGSKGELLLRLQQTDA